MAIDLTKLQTAAQAARARRPPLRGVAALVANLRRDPALRGPLPVETLVLAPVPWTEAGTWRLSALLAQAAGAGAAGLRVSPPWGAVLWSPGLTQEPPTLRRFAEWPAAAALMEPTGAPVLIAQPSPARLYAALDALMALPALPPPSFAPLVPLYHGLLPAPFFGLAHAVAPGSAAWLTPAAP